MTHALDALLSHQPAPASAEAGKVFPIRVVPDLFTGETVNVGVCVIAADGRRLVRVIDRPGRLECLYGAAAHEVVFLAKQAAHCAKHGLASPSPNVHFDAPRPFYNFAAEAALDAYFTDLVTVAIPDRRPSEIEHLTTERARQQVTELLQRIRRNVVLDNLLPESPNILINVQDRARLVNVPLQPPGGAGTIESADYGPETIRFHLLERLTDLAAVHQAGRADHLALFIVRPERRLTEKQLNAVDNAIDKVLWKAPRGMRVEVENVERTAELVLDWAEHVSPPPNDGTYALAA